MSMQRIGPREAVARPEFDALLRAWHSHSDDHTIGDADFGQAAWIHVHDGSTVYRLNADTTRAGVEEYLRLLDKHEGDLEWSIVPNRNGRDNAVAFGPDRQRPRYFYLYVRDGR
jgi:hypothetical protein